MKLVRWMRFTWELKKLRPLENPLSECYHIRTAERGEEKAISALILSAFSLDSAWSDAWKDLRQPMEAQLDNLFDRDDVPALVITNGPRIIGASALTVSPQSENHLFSGPCVLREYQNRGLGTALLAHSLTHLQRAGLSVAHGITKDNVVAGKFLYPKFGSTGQEYDCPSPVANLNTN